MKSEANSYIFIHENVFDNDGCEMAVHCLGLNVLSTRFTRLSCYDQAMVDFTHVIQGHFSAIKTIINTNECIMLIR